MKPLLVREDKWTIEVEILDDPMGEVDSSILDL
jgi:hypothetical protein